MKTKQISCFGCSILCDDVHVEFEEDGSFKSTINSCFRGNAFLKKYLSENRLKQPLQKQMGLEMYLDSQEANSIVEKEIKNANSIRIYGLEALSYQDQISVLFKAKEMVEKGKTVTIPGLHQCSKLLSVKYQSTIGHGINNADLFIFWKTDPTHSHPKLFGKLLFSRGMFRLSGKEMKKFIMVQKEDSELSRLKDILIDISQQKNSQVIQEVEKLLEGKPLESISLGKLSIENLRTLRTFLKATEYGIIICDTPIERNIEISKLNILLQKLNSFVKGRFTFLPLTMYPNELGLYSAASKIIGNNLKSIGTTSEPTDLAIVVGGEYLRDEMITDDIVFPESKIILFDNFKSKHSNKALITIPFKIPGIECAGTATRTDGVNVDLQKWHTTEEDVKSIRYTFESLSF